MDKARSDFQVDLTHKERVELLALCHDHHLVTTFRKGLEVPLHPNSREALSDVQTCVFFDLIDQKLIHEIARDGFDNDCGCTAFFSPTQAGMDVLRRHAEELGEAWTLSRIEWSEFPEVIDLSDPSSLVQNISGKVIAVREDSFEEDDALAGEFNLLRINRLSLIASHADFESAIGACSEAQPYRDVFLDEHDWLSIEEFGERFSSSGDRWGTIILLDYLKMHSRFIGLGLGQQMIQKILLQCAPGGGVVVITPFPLQFMGRGDIDAGSEDYENALDRLKRYYFGIGFCPHDRNPEIMFSDIESIVERSTKSKS